MKISPLRDHMSFIDEIAELHHSEWAHLSPGLTLEARKTALRNSAIREGMPTIYLAYEGDEFIGSAALIDHDMDTHPELSPWLAAVFVKERWRGQGIATLLVKHCETKASRASIEKLYLFTEFASQLYAKLGWESVERCKYKGVEVDVMCKTLAS